MTEAELTAEDVVRQFQNCIIDDIRTHYGRLKSNLTLQIDILFESRGTEFNWKHSHQTPVEYAEELIEDEKVVQLITDLYDRLKKIGEYEDAVMTVIYRLNEEARSGERQ